LPLKKQAISKTILDQYDKEWQGLLDMKAVRQATRQEDEWKDYQAKVVVFGDRPASCTLEICKNLAADIREAVKHEEAGAIKEDTIFNSVTTNEDVSRT
jgi:hypothetical protein